MGMYNKSFARFQATYTFLTLIAAITTLALTISLMCFKEVWRRVPINYALISLFTVC